MAGRATARTTYRRSMGRRRGWSWSREWPALTQKPPRGPSKTLGGLALTRRGEREPRFACGRRVDSRPHLLGWCSTLPYNANSVRAIVAGPQRRGLCLRRKAIPPRALALGRCAEWSSDATWVQGVTEGGDEAHSPRHRRDRGVLA